MRKFSTVTAVFVAGFLMLGATGCSKLKARSHINDGIAAFKNAKYAEAEEHFKQAAALDPDNINGTLNLAVSYMAQWIPGAESPENLEFAVKAKQEFQKVLDKDPKEESALEYLGNLAYNQAQSLPPDQKVAKFDEAVMWFKKLIEANPQKKEAYYYLGVIAYQKFHPALMLARVNLHMKDDEDPIKDKKVKQDLGDHYVAIIDDGEASLQKALDIDPEYDDAMAYLNLLIRQKADLLDSVEDYKKQEAIADSWQAKTLETRKKKADRKPAPGGIVQETK